MFANFDENMYEPGKKGDEKLQSFVHQHAHYAYSFAMNCNYLFMYTSAVGKLGKSTISIFFLSPQKE
jgi:hypothetical protein